MKTAIMIAVLCAAILLPTGVSATPGTDRTLFYYGWPSSFNYQTNWWSPDNVAQDMGQYGMVVLGAGLEATSRTDDSASEMLGSRQYIYKAFICDVGSLIDKLDSMIDDWGVIDTYRQRMG